MGFTVTELNVERRRRQGFEEYVQLLHWIDHMEGMMRCRIVMSTMDVVRNDRSPTVNFSVPLEEVPRLFLTRQEVRWRAAAAAARRRGFCLALPPSGPALVEF